MGKIDFPQMNFKHAQFRDSLILKSRNSSKQILQWFDGARKFKLLYRASRDGFKASEFHRLCDNQGPTLSIIQSVNGFIFGGYVSKPWLSSSLYVSCDMSPAWIFSLTNPSNHPLKIPSKNRGDCMYDSIMYGPTFGGNHDLHIADMANMNTNSYANIGASYHSPEIQNGQTFLCGSYKFQVAEIEVFQVAL